MLFLNISMQAPGEALVPWWQHPEVKMKAGLDPRTQVRTPCGNPWLLGFRVGAFSRFRSLLHLALALDTVATYRALPTDTAVTRPIACCVPSAGAGPTTEECSSQS